MKVIIKIASWTSLEIHWLGLHFPMQEGVGWSLAGEGTKIPQASWPKNHGLFGRNDSIYQILKGP